MLVLLGINVILCVVSSVVFITEGSESIISKWHLSNGNADKTIEIGQGNLKLLYTSNEGKLASYINSRNLVCYVRSPSLVVC